MKRFAVLAGAALALLLGAAAGGQAPPGVEVRIWVEGEVEREEARSPTVGDPITVRIEVRHPADVAVASSSDLWRMGAMEASLAEVRPLEAGVTEVVLRTRAFTTGRFEAPLPPIELERAGEFWGSVELDAVVVTVESVLDPFRLEPRPLSAPQSLPEGERTLAPWLWGVIGALIALAAGSTVWRLRRLWRGEEASTAVEADASSAANWDGLRIDDRLSGAEQCAEIGRQVRRRLGDVYGIRAESATATELPRRLAAAGAPASTVERVRTLLRECDAAQYGGAGPAPARLDGYRQLAQSILSESGGWGRRDAV